MARPEKHIFVCSQHRPVDHPRGACAHKGANEVLEAFWREQRARAAYDRISVTIAGCFGPCQQGANVVVYPEGVLYCGVTKEDVAEIFESHLLGGVPVERLRAPTEVW